MTPINVLTRTEGIVLQTREYIEADLIVTYLTPARGIIKSFAKSPRKTRSRFGSSPEPLTHAKISLWGREQSMPRITQSDIISSFHKLREDFQDFVNISKLSEILISLTPEGLPNSKLFSFFLNIITFLASVEQKQKDALYLVFQISLLALLGYAPHLKSCGKCGEESRDFYPEAGTALCKRCSSSRQRGNEPSIRISNRTAHFYSHGIGWPIKASTRLRPSRETVSELSALLEAHITNLLNKKLQTSEFLSKV
ncbi:MAG TPA: DNA repair protein RecO [Nitrospirae bacterium]|nr:DNA repair protein RecO [Nitrospirota bacterium]